MKKRIISSVLATICAISAMSFSAFADVTAAGGEAKLAATGSVQAPTIKVTVPTAATFILNPYGLSVDVSTDAKAKTDAVLSAAFDITSESDVGLDIYVSGTATVGGNIKLVKEAVATGDTGNKAFIYLKGTQATAAASLKTNGTAAAYAAATEAGKPGDVIITETIKDTLLGQVEAKPATGTAKTILACQFGGSVSDAAKVQWTSKDTVKANLVFRFDVTPKAAG